MELSNWPCQVPNDLGGCRWDGVVEDYEDARDMPKQGLPSRDGGIYGANFLTKLIG